ncbi:hypothetical protein [Candidatus Marithrix sp. Canyon 246]|uniref:hypothetical protein n=1 Tax=Candidatus Marithrix sp. Canyon 246 TaxID=1827136 RepID=UPI001495B153|nr:hypothetical protein [Candidatus Marithrix sp. Canyon 246]
MYIITFIIFKELNEVYKAYNRADYPTALEKLKQCLNLARQAKNQQAIGSLSRLPA